MAEYKPVELLQDWRRWKPGHQVALFPGVANLLIRLRIAKPVEAKRKRGRPRKYPVADGR